MFKNKIICIKGTGSFGKKIALNYCGVILKKLEFFLEMMKQWYLQEKFIAKQDKVHYWRCKRYRIFRAIHKRK